jgi:GrpE
MQLATAGTHASSGLGTGPVIGIVGGLLLAGIAIGAAITRARLSKPVPRSAAGQPTPQPSSAASSQGSRQHRSIDDPVLVQSLIALDVKARGAAWQPLVAAALSACGIVADYPLREAFDASRHHVVDTDTTTDPAQDMTICEVERPGYVRWGECMSPADVVVLRYQPDQSSGAGR